MSKVNVPIKFLYLGFLCFVICDFTTATQIKCAEYNEYCQEHWECCSNTCLTYSYRCIGKKRPIPAVERPTLTFEELLESIAQSNIIPKYEYNQPQTNKRGKSYTLKSLLNNNREWEGVQAEEPVLQDRFAAVEARSGANGPQYIFFVLLPQESTRKAKQLEQQTQSPIDDNPTIVKVEDSQEDVTESDAVEASTERCKANGAKCYRNEECCTQRCHGFLHQCVT
ncbi:uncharacterized protein LOC129247442 [Anastrepha obliqua]|uniref:uncharacterized protein LOC129247442 n=1 Tax=Anastrepha obliqua TaxID=95512 RepID=UPI00240A7926|nr:uncharacterized protein LOC129247442 [Anastrepha obliqua]